jgi:protein-S-isoprenylcysteine O-methyltransferase Ste14
MVLGKGTETWDWVWEGLFSPVLVSILVVAGLDIRSGWAPLPLWVWPIGLVLFVLGGGLFLRAMAENPFFEKTVRIQSERGHHVIDTGPYRTVRHPGYVGMFAFILSFPLLLTSAWALLPTALTMIGLLVRTALEDRTLQNKLPGYADYVARVRWRLIPGVW